jgi:hypothetical protein
MGKFLIIFMLKAVLIFLNILAVYS